MWFKDTLFIVFYRLWEIRLVYKLSSTDSGNQPPYSLITWFTLNHVRWFSFMFSWNFYKKSNQLARCILFSEIENLIYQLGYIAMTLSIVFDYKVNHNIKNCTHCFLRWLEIVLKFIFCSCSSVKFNMVCCDCMHNSTSSIACQLLKLIW